MDDWLLELTEKPKAELIESIEQIVLQSPECLSVLGIPGFEEEGEDEYDEDYYG